jgi:hypothetical protein
MELKIFYDEYFGPVKIAGKSFDEIRLLKNYLK